MFNTRTMYDFMYAYTYMLIIAFLAQVLFSGHELVMADWVPASSPAAGRLCGFCGLPRGELYPLLRVCSGELLLACCICWLTAEIQQLAVELADDDLELGLAAEVLEGVYRRLRARTVRRRLQSQPAAE